MLLAFFPERRRGTVTLEGEKLIVLKPEGGVEWRVTLDPQTSLSKTMVHKEGEQTISVTFVSFETVEGIKFEKEIRRSAGEASPGAVIRFTKTIINQPVDGAPFSLKAKDRAEPNTVVDYCGDQSKETSKMSTARLRSALTPCAIRTTGTRAKTMTSFTGLHR